MKNLIKIFVLIVSLSIFSCQDEPVEFPEAADIDKVILKDSELFEMINQVVTPGSNPTDQIVCIDFIYVFKVIVYDSNRIPIGSQTISGDLQFSAFLSTIPANQSISISYPITTTLADGTVFTVNNNAELKIAIDSCSKDDIISYCGGLFGDPVGSCVWKVPYTQNQNNNYTSGVFRANSDGTLEFNYNNIDYTGTWVFLFVDDKLHLNINLEGTSQVAQDWNFDKKIQFSEEKIIILSTPKTITLKKYCETTTPYNVGDIGPNGGFVFYDKGSFSNGWRYIEAAPNDLAVSEWGCLGSLIPNANNSQIGNGFYNTAIITNFHDNLVNFYTNPAICNSLNDGTVASQKAQLFTINGKDAWFLPSENELQLMYQNLKVQNIGNFSNSVYLSSTQFDLNNAKTIDFSNGTQQNTPKNISVNLKSRAVRYF